MTKEVSPWIAVVGILLTLAAIQLVYWRGLVSPPQRFRGEPAGGGGGGSAEPQPLGESACDVSTFAGRRASGYLDGTAPEALFDGPAGIAVSPSGAIYVADSRNHRIRQISPDGVVTTLAGGEAPAAVGALADGPASQARFANPAGVTVAPDGAILVADTGNHLIRRISPSGAVSTYAGAKTERDDLGRFAGGYRDGAASEALFRYPVGLAADRAGAIYVADAGNHCVRRISPSGQVATIPTTGEDALQSPTELTLAAGDRLWVADTAGGALWTGPTAGPLRKWRPAAEDDAIGAPSGLLAVADTLYVLDAQRQSLFRLRGDASQLLAGDQAGAAGYADGPGLFARFASPAALAPAPGGDLYLADFGNNCIRRVTMTTRSQEDP